MAKNKFFVGMSKVAIAAVLTATLAPVGNAFAANHDFWKDGSNKGSIRTISTNRLALMDLLENTTGYSYEIDGKLYSADKVDELYATGVSKDGIAEAIKKAGLESQGEATAKLAVTSVSAINGSQVQVKFNAPADETSAEQAANIVVKGVGSVSDPVINDRSLSKDGKVLTLTANLGFNGKYSVEILNTGATKVLSKDNPTKSFEGKVEILDIKDTVAPKVSGIEYGVTTATVKFSEPLKSVGTISLDGVELVSGTGYTAFVQGKDELEIKGLTPGKSYELSIVGAKDNAGNNISPNPTTLTLNMSEDKVKPTVSVTSKDAIVTLDFSEKIGITPGTNDTTQGTLVIGGTTVNLNDAATTLIPDANDDTKYTYDASALISGDFLNADVKVSGYKDLAGNIGDDFTTSVLLTKDTTAPKYVSALTKGKKIAVKFNEETKASSLTAVAIKHTSPDNVVTNIPAAAVTAADSYDVNGDTVISDDDKTYIALDVAATETSILNTDKDALLPGTYEVTIAAGKVTDATTPGNATTAPVKFTVVVNATEADKDAIVEVHPTDTKQVLATPGAIEVKFNKLMGASALDYKNYKLEGVTIPSTSELYFDGTKDTVRINLPVGYVSVKGARLLEVANVTDKDGNTLKTGKTSADVTLIENVKPQATKVELVDAQNIKVTFSESLDTLPTVSGVTVKVNGVKETLDSTTPFALDATTKIITIKAAAATAFKLTDTITVEFKDSNIKDKAGNTVKDITLSK